jgi:hypothetical protein
MHAAGRTIIPTGGDDDGKRPLVGWRRYQTERPSDDELQKWHIELHPGVWAIVCGAESRVVVVDTDTEEST